MRNRKWNKVLGLMCAFALLVAQLATGDLTSVVGEEAAGYVVTVSADRTSVTPGDTVSLTATVTYNGEEITDLDVEGLNFTWWADSWNDHADGNSDATVSDEHSLTEATTTLPTEGTYYIAGELYDSNWTSLYRAYVIITVTASADEPVSIELDNGDFETGDSSNWELTGFSSVTTDGSATNNQTYMLNLWLSNDEDVAASASYTVTLTAGTYSFGFELSGGAWDGGLSYQVVDASGNALTSSSAVGATAGWDVWTSYTTDEFTLTEDTEVTFVLSGTVTAWYWGYLDNLTLTGTGTLVETDTTVYDAEINVEKVDGLSDDFVMGMDISSIISEFDSGVTYKDFDGNTIDNVTDFCKFLAEDCGITHVRVRVWNDPYDSDGNGYGGGNCDVNKAVEIAKACKEAGLSLLVDFHYSDFWADPSKQDAPKAWSEYTLEEKETAIAEFTTDALTKIAVTGVDVGMVQIGNETTGGLCGETTTANMCTLFNAASAAIRDFDDTIQIAVHVTNPESGKMTTWASNLNTYSVDYDILATSYYVYWHGSLDNLISEMEYVQETYGKDVMVAETSYAYTLDDTDGHDNTVREGSNDTGMDYAFTVQGQADCIRNVIAAVSEAGGLGVFYWEPAWITVGDTSGLTGDEYDAQVTANQALWEKYGSGWASSYSADYDPDDAGVWYGGSAVDNQAMFYADGTPTASLNVWNYVKTGAVSNDVSVDSIAAVEETIYVGGTYTLPDTVTVTYNTGSVEESVAWDTDDISYIDVTQPGIYTVTGTVTLSQEVTSGDYEGCTTLTTTYTLTVKEANLITDADDASFETGDHFTFANSNITAENVYDGNYSLHWWQESETTGSATYNEEITLEAGWYTFEAAAMGAAGDTVMVSILDTEGNVLFEGDAVTLTGWTSNLSEWLTPYVTFYLSEETIVKLNVSLGITAGGWGGVDCMYLHQHVSAVYDANDDGTHYVTCNDCGEVLADAENCSLEVSALTAMNGEANAYVTYTCSDCGYEATSDIVASITGTSSYTVKAGETAAADAEYSITDEPAGLGIEYLTEYVSSDEDVAEVDADGNIMGIRAGEATITYLVYAELTIGEDELVVIVGSKEIMLTVTADSVVTSESESTETETGETESEDTETEDTEEDGEAENTEGADIEGTESETASDGTESGGTSNSASSSTSSPKTGDASPVIPIVVVLFGCAAVIAASKKRVA